MSARKVALVTGSSRGIGRATALALATAGCDVVINYHGDGGDIAGLTRELEGKGAAVLVAEADISQPGQVDSLFKQIRARFGRLDILVNNAGITRDKSFKKMTLESWREVIDVNLTGAYLCCQHAAPWMMEQGSGRIINISSVVGQTGNFGQTNYAAAKAGLLGLTKSLALECAKSGVTVNAICPGFIHTDMVTQIPEAVLNSLKERIPMKRLGRPEEVAELVVFLGTQAAYMTGAELNLNGGFFTG